MNYSTNYNLNKPERSEQFNIDHWNNNTDVIDTQMHINKVNIAQNATDIATLFTGLNTKNTSDTNSVFYKLMKLIYPVGSLYWSSKSTNPASLFGGTWVQIKDRFVLACGDTYKTVGATGGASSVTLSVSNMPSHTHSFTPSGTVSSHNHGLNNHTHSFSWGGTTGEMNKNSVGSWGTRVSNSKDGGNGDDRYTPSTSGNVSVNMSSYIRTLWQRPDDTYKASREHMFTMDLSHKHTYSGSGTTGGASGNTESTTPTFSGIAGTTGSNGSGTAFSILPPYVVKFCWERTA